MTIKKVLEFIHSFNNAHYFLLLYRLSLFLCWEYIVREIVFYILGYH